MQKLKPVKLISANALKEMAAVTAKIADTVNETEEIVAHRRSWRKESIRLKLMFHSKNDYDNRALFRIKT